MRVDDEGVRRTGAGTGSDTGAAQATGVIVRDLMWTIWARGDVDKSPEISTGRSAKVSRRAPGGGVLEGHTGQVNIWAWSPNRTVTAPTSDDITVCLGVGATAWLSWMTE